MRSFILLALLSTLALVEAKCNPRAVNIEYKAESARELKVHKVCAGVRCGPPVLTLKSICTEVACIDGSRCNTCSASLKANDLPQEVTKSLKYGVYFDDEPKSFYSFMAKSQFQGAWYAQNGWILGCKNVPRVGCTNRSGCVNKKSCSCLVNDVALSLQGCYQTYFRELNAGSLNACVDDDTSNGLMPGEQVGVDSPSNGCK